MIRLEISEHEDCEHVQRVELSGSVVVSYTGVLLVAEKIRALCQQHPEYPYGGRSKTGLATITISTSSSNRLINRFQFH